jgi:hypothetical protein
MLELLQNDGEIIKDEIRIIKLVHIFYTKLYTIDIIFKENQQPTVKEILSQVTRVLTDEQIKGVEKLPHIKEVYNTLKDLANNKASGKDGITAEVLKECWDFIANDFYALVKQF